MNTPASRMNAAITRCPQRVFTVGIPVIIMTSYLFLALQHDLGMSVPAIAGGTALVTLSLAIAFYAGERRGISWSPFFVLAMAALIRIPFVFRPPELSDDIYRYAWDGLQILSGHNPYSYAPAFHGVSGESAAFLAAHINHPDLVTIYPPAAQMVFALGSFFSDSVTGIKALLSVMDIATCVLILKVLSGMHLPAWRAALYAWHPLPVIEISASGHIDGAGVLFLLLGLFLAVSGEESSGRTPRPTNSRVARSKEDFVSLTAGLSFALSVLIKFVPLIFLPLFLLFISAQRVRMFLAGFVSGTVLLVVPFLPDMYNMVGTLGIYLQNWEFSNFAFRTLRTATSSGPGARSVLSAVFLLCVVVLSILFVRRKRPCVLMVRSGRSSDAPNHCGRKIAEDLSSSFTRALYGTAFLYLLLTPTLHPWYGLYLVCLFPFFAEPGGLILSWAVFLSYYVLIDYTLLGQWVENDAVPAAIWIASVAGSLLIFMAGQVIPDRPSKSK